MKNSGSPTWIRTRDLRINSPSLYRLSYQGIDKSDMILSKVTTVKDLPLVTATNVALNANLETVFAYFFAQFLGQHCDNTDALLSGENARGQNSFSIKRKGSMH